MSLFPSSNITVFLCDVYGEDVARFPLPDGDHGLYFLHPFVMIRDNSINQSINQSIKHHHAYRRTNERMNEGSRLHY